MKESFICITMLFIFVVASCNKSDDKIQRQEEYSDEIFREGSTPDNLKGKRGSSEFDAVGTEDAVTQ